MPCLTHPIPQASGTAPVVQVDVADSFLLSSGITLNAGVNPSSVCNTPVVFLWRVAKSGVSLDLPGLGATSTQARLQLSGPRLMAAGVKPGDTLTVSLETYFEGNSGASSTQSKSARVRGDPLVASLTGDKGEVAATATLRFSAEASSDPSDPTNLESMR